MEPEESLLEGPEYEALLQEIVDNERDDAYWEHLLADGWDR